MINFFYEFCNFQIKDEYFFVKNISFLLKNEKGKIGEINYIFCDDPSLLRMNLKFLKKNFYTDVIAFDYSLKKNISGDIFVSIDRILENSEKWNQLFSVELTRVMIHALLHFLGYDDKKKIDIKIMKKKENFYLNLFYQ